jgi:hypothetical protein
MDDGNQDKRQNDAGDLPRLGVQQGGWGNIDRLLSPPGRHLRCQHQGRNSRPRVRGRDPLIGRIVAYPLENGFDFGVFASVACPL